MPANLTDVDAFTSPVVVPVDADPANAASVVQGFQPLANRTFWLHERITETAADARRVEGVDFSGGGGVPANTADGACFLGNVNSGAVFLDIGKYMQNGAVLDTVAVNVHPGASRSGANRMNFTLVKRTGTVTQTTVGSQTFDDGTGNVQSIAWTGLALTLDLANEGYVLIGQLGNTAASANDHILEVALVWTRPGLV